MSFETQDAELAPLLKNRYTEPIAMNVPVLTDDLAPVEYYNSGRLQELVFYMLCDLNHPTC